MSALSCGHHHGFVCLAYEWALPIAVEAQMQEQITIKRRIYPLFTPSASWPLACRLHQSIGPQSVLLSSTDESGGRPLVARLWDLAFSVDVCDAALFGGATLADIWERRRIEDEKDPLCAFL